MNKIVQVKFNYIKINNIIFKYIYKILTKKK